MEIAERLALLIEAKSGGAIAELKKTVKSAEDLTVAQDRTTLSAAKMAAAEDKAAASLAKAQVAEAKASGSTEAFAAAQQNSALASEKAAVSKAQAAAAADQLALSELRAKEASAALGSQATGTAGLLNKLGLSGTSAAAALQALTPLLAFAALGFGVKILKDGVEHFQKLTGQVRGLKAVTGGTAQDISLLVGQMHQLGIEPDQAQKAFLRFGAALGDGSSKLADYGIKVAQNKDGTTNLLGTLENLRTAYQGTSDATTRDAIAKQLGGRAAASLIPLLKLTNDQVKELNKHTRESGGIVNDQDLANGRALAIAGNQMKEAFQNAELVMTKGLVPSATKLLELITSTVEAANKFGSLDSKGLGPVKHDQRLFGIPGTQGIARFLMGEDKQSTAELKAAKDAETEATKKNKDAQDRLTQSLTGEISAQRAVRDAANGLVDARQNESDAQDRLNQLLKDGAVDEKAVASAKKDLEHASRSVQRAIESEHDAQQALNKARERASALDLADAQNKVTLSGDRITSAKAAEQQAQEKLDALLGSGDSTAGQIAAAQAEVKQKHDETTQAIIDQGHATEDLTKTQQKGTDQDPEVIAAQRRVRDAHDAVKDAIDAQKDAMDRLHTAEAGDPDYARKVADARRDLARAHQGVADAQQNQITAALGLQTATDKMNGSLKNAGDNLQTIIDKFLGLKALGVDVSSILSLLGIDPASSLSSGAADPSAGLPRRVKGGRLEPYQAYLVAEPGTGGEIIHMGSQGGYAMPAGHKAGHQIHMPVYVSDARTGRDIVREMSWELRTTILPRLEQV